jgi:hypothetical protein
MTACSRSTSITTRTHAADAVFLSSPTNAVNGYTVTRDSFELQPGQQKAILLEVRSSTGVIDMCFMLSGAGIDVSVADTADKLRLPSASLSLGTARWACARRTLAAPAAGFYTLGVSCRAGETSPAVVQRIFIQAADLFVPLNQILGSDIIIPGACVRGRGRSAVLLKSRGAQWPPCRPRLRCL